jgi:hypothetical protein
MIGLQAIGSGQKDRSSDLGHEAFFGRERLTYQRKLSAKSAAIESCFAAHRTE